MPYIVLPPRSILRREHCCERGLIQKSGILVREFVFKAFVSREEHRDRASHLPFCREWLPADFRTYFFNIDIYRMYLERAQGGHNFIDYGR